MNYIPEITYGGIDGTITTTAVIAGAMGLNLQPIAIIALAFSSIVADGISMAVGSFQSEKTRKDPKDKTKVMVFTFLSFVLFGSIITLPFIIAHYYPSYSPDRFHVLLLTSVMLFFIGTLQPSTSNKTKLSNGLETMVLGFTTAIVAYIISSVIEKKFLSNEL